MAAAPRLRVGIAGAGIMAINNAMVLAQDPRVELVGVASRTVEGARAFVARTSETLGLAKVRACADVAEMINGGELDALVITTPDDAHADIAVAGAQHGLHLLIEKPLATTAADAQRIVDAVRSAGVVAMTLFNHRWVPAYAQAKQLIGDLGAPVVGYARKNDTIDVPTEMIGRWASRTSCAWFLSSHDIDLMSWLVDSRVERVYATARSGLLVRRGIDTPDAVQIQAHFANGAIATFESAWVYPTTFPTQVDSYVTLVSEGGVVQLDRQRENISVATDERFSFPRNMLNRTQHGSRAGAYRDAIEHWVSCALTGDEPLITIESSRDVTAVLAAAHQSIATGEPVEVAA